MIPKYHKLIINFYKLYIIIISIILIYSFRKVFLIFGYYLNVICRSLYIKCIYILGYIFLTHQKSQEFNKMFFLYNF